MGCWRCENCGYPNCDADICIYCGWIEGGRCASHGTALEEIRGHYHCPICTLDKITGGNSAKSN